MDFTERLERNPDFQQVVAHVQADRALLMHRLAYLRADEFTSLDDYHHEIEALKGEIRGLDRFLRAPDEVQLLSQ
jgi:hypothetical protein